MKTKTLEDNLFILHFSCLGDWEKVTEGGPWHFRGNAVLFAPYDGFTKPSMIELNTLDMWIQIHDLPIGYSSMIKALSSKVGKFVSLELPSNNFAGNFFRVRVTIDVRYPLKNHVSLSRAGKREIFIVKYEKLPTWCSVCGMLGHTYKEHGDGIHAPSALVFRNLRAPGIIVREAVQVVEEVGAVDVMEALAVVETEMTLETNTSMQLWIPRTQRMRILRWMMYKETV